MDLAKAACRNLSPHYFEDAAWRDYALKVCDGCPVRLECLEYVHPAVNEYDGVVGGYVWENGQPRYIAGRSDQILLKYWTKYRTGKHYNKFDDVKLDRFMDGHYSWRDMTIEERKEVALRMASKGKTLDAIQELTHLRWQTIKDITRMSA